MVIKQAELITSAPLKDHVAVNPCLFSMTPAIGAPAKAPRDAMAKAMPILVPIKARLSKLRYTNTVGGSETKVPEKIP